jgi:hypothetical protein
LEKIMYVLWRDPREDRTQFHKRLRTDVAQQLIKLGARGVTINVSDAEVDPAIARVTQMKSRPLQEAVAQVWVDTSNPEFRQPIDDALQAACMKIAGYLVCESEPIHNKRHPPVTGERTVGFSQMAFFPKPRRLAYDAWMEIWHGSHTRVAIDTQDTYLYRQNVILRALTPGAPHYDAIVEEGFEKASMTDLHAFYDAIGDDAKLVRNEKAMMESCARFIDFDQIDVIATSQYVLKPIGPD